VGGTGTAVGRSDEEEAPEAVQEIYVHGRGIVMGELDNDGSDACENLALVSESGTDEV